MQNTCLRKNWDPVYVETFPNQNNPIKKKKKSKSYKQLLKLYVKESNTIGKKKNQKILNVVSHSRNAN